MSPSEPQRDPLTPAQSIQQTDGSSVGGSDGTAVGSSVGITVGSADGGAVGAAVGLWVGATDGASVGAAEGSKVGINVGVTVGWGVRSVDHIRRPFITLQRGADNDVIDAVAVHIPSTGYGCSETISGSPSQDLEACSITRSECIHVNCRETRVP